MSVDRKTRAEAALQAGRTALERRDWEGAARAFRESLERSETAEAHEGLSWIARLRNDVDQLLASRERAYRLYTRAGDDRGAARMAMWLAADYADYRGELAVSGGWRQLSDRHLQGLPLSEEHARAELLRGDAILLYEVDTAAAKECARKAREIAGKIGNRDIATLSLAIEGLALTYECDFANGVRLLDEVAAAVLGEDAQDPLWVSWVMCYVLCACELARDFGRAAEWCRKARAYAEKFEIGSAQAICRLHYASTLVWRGEWAEAETQIAEAATMLECSVPFAAEAQVRLGELRRLQGRVEEAARLFSGAEWHPHALFGLAEIALDSGRPHDAVELVQRALRQTTEGNRHQRAIGLELLVRAQSLMGHHDAARASLAALEEISGRSGSPALRAAACVSAAVLATRSQQFEEAVGLLEDALVLFGRTAGSYETARTRLELASVLVELGRLDRARAEAVQARTALEQLGSHLQARRAAALLGDIERRAKGAAGRPAGPVALTPRQAEILRLIARGNSDREIAGALGLSEHTVHRHVANILSRLESPTRAAAAAQAASRGLI